MTTKENAVAVSEPEIPQAYDVVQSDPFVAMVERLATNADVDADKLDKLVNIQMRIMDRNAEAEFNAALSRVQAKIDTIPASSFNPQTHSRYAKLEAIHRVIKPIYTAEGFSTSFTQASPLREGCIRVEGVLRHAAGHSVDHYAAELEVDDHGIAGKANKTKVHGTGSSLTYARRYCECMMFDLSTGDDVDGNESGGAPEVRYITDKQQGTIQDLLTAYDDAGGDADEEKFCKWAKVESTEKIPNHKFASIVKNMKGKIDKLNADG